MHGRGWSCAIIATCAAALTGLVAGAAPAAELRFGGISVEGRIGIGLAIDRDRVTPGAFGDARLTAPLFGGPLGIEVGLFGLGTDLDTPHETYATLTWDQGALRLGAGVPRPAYDLAALSPLERLAPQIGLSAERIAATRSRMTWGAMYGGYLPLGVRMSGRRGALDWALSAHRAAARDLTVASLGLDWQADGWRLAGAVEWGSDGAWAGKGQIARDLGRLRIGASVYAAPLPGAPDLKEAFLVWRTSERVAYTALLQRSSGPGDTLGLLAVEMGLGRRGHLVAALTAENGRPSASIGMDWNF